MTRTASASTGVLARIVEAVVGSASAPASLGALHGPIDPRALCRAAEVSRLAELGRREVREVTLSTLVSPERVLGALRASLEDRCLVWVVVTPDEVARDALHAAFPHLAVDLSGGAVAGSGLVWGLNTTRLLRKVLAEVPSARAALAGVDASRTPVRTRLVLLEARVRLSRDGLVRRVLMDPRTWVYLLVFVYSAVRAVPVVLVPQFHGNVLVLWAIDVITAIPYTWGVLAMVTAGKPAVRAAGTITALVTFMAPYVYFWHHGRDYPQIVVIVVAAMILLSIFVEVGRFAQERWLRSLYRRDLRKSRQDR